MTKRDVVRAILRDRRLEPAGEARAFAPANIALCKYWGKRDEELNLPVTPSLSVSLGALGAETALSVVDGPDVVIVNGASADDRVVRRVTDYLDLFRPEPDVGYRVETNSSVPLAAGLASSSSGFAALALALNTLYDWKLDARALSILARLGSGSACRSLYPGFARWRAGERADGMDSYAEPIEAEWPAFRIGLLTLSAAPKPIGSREAMRRTRETSLLYRSWPDKVRGDIAAIEAAIRARDLPALGEAAESNALAMHGTMMDTRPPIIYWLPETVTALRAVFQLRADGVPVYATMDAGPNVKILFEKQHAADVRERFPDIRIIDVHNTDARCPFPDAG